MEAVRKRGSQQEEIKSLAKEKAARTHAKEDTPTMLRRVTREINALLDITGNTSRTTVHEVAGFIFPHFDKEQLDKIVQEAEQPEKKIS